MRHSEISKLQRLSFATFIVHCTLSYPAAELLDALWSFNVFDFLKHYFSRNSSGISCRASQLSEFFTWLKNHVCGHHILHAAHINWPCYLGV